MFSGDKEFMLAGGFFAGAYMSTDQGDSWSRVTGGPDSMNMLYGVGVLDSIGLITGYYTDGMGQFVNLLYLTRDSGKTWSQLDSPPGATGVLITKNWWYLQKDKGFWVSTDEGKTWAMTPPKTNVSFRGLYRWGDKVITSSYPFLFYSTDDPLKWKSTSGPYEFQMYDVIPAGEVLININPYNPDTIAVSEDGANTWAFKKIPDGEVPIAFQKRIDTLYMCTQKGIFTSLNLGDSWDTLQFFPAYCHPRWCSTGEDDFYLSNDPGGLFRVNIPTNSFQDITRGLPFSKTIDIIPLNGDVLALDESRGIQRWTESGGWEYPSPLWPQQRALTMTEFDDRIWVSSEPFSIYRGLNASASLWKEIPLAPGVDARRGIRFEALGDTLLLMCEDTIYGNKILYTTAPYQSWREFAIVHPTWGTAEKFTSKDHVWFALFPGVLARSFDQGVTWEPIAENLETNHPSVTYVISDLHRVGDWLVIDHETTNTIWGDKRIWYSSDLGKFWEYDVPWQSRPLTYQNGYYFFNGQLSTGLFVGTWLDEYGISISDNLKKEYISTQSIAIDEKYIYLGTYDRGVWRRAISGLLPVAIESPESEARENLSFAVFPNPSSGQINITGLNASPEGYSWSLISLNGEQLLQGSWYDAPLHSIDISQLSNGVYLLQVVGELGHGHTLVFRQ